VNIEALLDVHDVARILGTSPGHVYDLAESRDPAVRLPHVKIRRLLRFRAEDVRAYVEARVSA
jgi:excisionase family DNA binding protein